MLIAPNLNRLQGAAAVILCVAGHCPAGSGDGITSAQGAKIRQVHQQLVIAILRLDAARQKLSMDQSA